MHRPTATAVARVTRRFAETTKTGKPYVKFLAELPSRTWSGKTYATRIEVLSFRPESVERVHPGDWIMATGEAEASVREYQGKAFASLVITGAVSRLPVTSDGHTSPSSPPTATAPASATATTPPDEDSPATQAADPPGQGAAPTATAPADGGVPEDPDDLPF